MADRGNEADPAVGGAPGPPPPGEWGRLRRFGVWSGLAVVVVVAYAFVTTRVGFVWPAPLVLPQHVTWEGLPYSLDNEAGCHSLDVWSRFHHSGLGHPRFVPFRAVGHLTSAIYFGAPEVLSDIPRRYDAPHYNDLLVRRGACYVAYQGEFGG